MKIIKSSGENPIEATCQECNTLFSFTLPEVSIKTWVEDGMVNERYLGLFCREYWCDIYKMKKAVINCPCCNNEIKVEGYMEKALEPEKIGRRTVDKSELSTVYY